MSETAAPEPSLAQAKSRPRLGREIAFLALILLLALGLRIAFTYQVHTSPYETLTHLIPGTDMQMYDSIARWILDNNWYEKRADASPLYPYFVLPVLYKLAGADRAPKPDFIPYSIEGAADPGQVAYLRAIARVKIYQGILDTLTVLLIYLLARRLYGVRAAVYASLGAAVYVPFIVYQGQILSESVLSLAVVAFFFVVLGLEGRLSPRRAAACGLLLGLSIAAKPTCIVFAPLGVVLVLRESGWKLRPVIAPLAVMAALCLAVLAPFAYRNYRAVGEFHLVRGNSGVMLYMGNNPDASGAYRNPSGPAADELSAKSAALPLAQKDALYRAAALRFVADNPRKALALLWTKFCFFFGAREIPNNISVTLFRQTTFLLPNAFATWGLVLPFAVAGFLFSLRMRNVLFVAGQILIYSATIILFVVVGRYRLAVVPLLFPAAGFAAAELILAIKSLNFRRTIAIAVCVAALALAVNWFDFSNTLDEKLHPAGFASREGGSVVIRDDSDYATPYGAYTLGRQTEITKYLYVTEPLAGLQRASVFIHLKSLSPGTIFVELNDVTQDLRVEPSSNRWVRIDYPPAAVLPGLNSVYLKSDGRVRAFIYADDVHNFGRSIYSPDGLDWLYDNLDRLSYCNSPSLHMGGHEFKIRLLLDYAVPAPPAPQPPAASPGAAG